MANPGKIMTVRINLKSYQGGYIFDIDTVTPIPTGLTLALQSIVYEDLGDANVPRNIIKDLIDTYNNNATSYWQNIKGGVPGGGIAARPSPFDVTLSKDGITPYALPVYMLYVCEISNWRFRGDGNKDIFRHRQPTKNYPKGKEPSDMFHSFPKLDPRDHHTAVGLYVKDSDFAKHPDDNFNGFFFDLNMVVYEPNGQETMLIIDPKIRNP